MPNFAPSPVLLPQKLGEAILSGHNNTGDKDKWLEAHKSIRTYLAMVARAASNAGIDPAFQAAVLAQENGGFEKWSTNAHSSANANGIAQFIPDTWNGAWNPYRNKSPNDPQYAIPAQAIFLRNKLKDNNGDMGKAAADYYGHDATTPAYVAGVRRYFDELNKHHVFSDAGKSIITGVGDAAKGILKGAEDSVNAASKFADVILHPAKLAELLADAFAWWVKLVWRALWRYVFAPPFHWCQRATIYYFDNIMGSKDGQNDSYYYTYAGTVTVAFWAVGYGILWRKSDSPTTKAELPQDTALGKGIQGIGGVVARKNVASPDKVKDKTPVKPTPRASTVKITGVKSLSAIRRRTVSITQNGTGENHNGNSGPRATGGNPPSASATGAAGSEDGDVKQGEGEAPHAEGVTA